MGEKKKVTPDVSVVDLKGVSAVEMTNDKQWVAWLTLRDQDGKNANLGIPAEQAWRLMEDLQFIFAGIPTMRGTLSPDLQKAADALAEDFTEEDYERYADYLFDEDYIFDCDE